jgi:hypothetical protein
MMKSQHITLKLIRTLQEWLARNTLHDIGADLNQVANATRAYETAELMPPVVTLCGSTYFKEEFEAVQRLETQNGRIVLTVGMFTHRDGFAVSEGMKKELDDLHKRKIDISDEIIVINVGGYVGESTRSEIEYATSHGVMVRWLHVDKVPAPWGPYVCPHETAYLAKFSRTGEGGAVAEQPTGRTELPKIVPEMIPSPNAQAEIQEPDMESVDALERAGRLALVEETRKAWRTRPTIVEDQARDEHLAASGFMRSAEDQVTRDARQAYESRYHKIAAEVGIQAWTMAYRRMVEAGVQECSGKEIENLARTLEA